MTATTSRVVCWWANHPQPVAAVLDLADIADNARILATFTPQHRAEIERLGDDLRWIERLRTDEPAEVLSAYHERPVHGIYLDLECERVADELQADVLVRAQLIASLIAGAR